MKDKFPFSVLYAVLPRVSMNSWVLLGLLLFAFANYARSLHFGFFLDDSFQILTNRLVQDLNRFTEHFSLSTVDQGGSSAPGGIYYKPIMMIAYSFFWQMTPNEPLAFRFFQLVIHALNSFMVFLVFKSILSTQKNIVAGFVALVFLIHPINAEAVLFIADLQEPLFTLFGLLGLLSVIHLESGRGIALAGLFFFLSLLSKETGILYSVIGLGYAFLLKPKVIKKLFIVLMIVGVMYAILRFGVANLAVLHSNTMRISRADFVTRLLTMPKILIHYIHLFFWPQEISLTQDWIVESASLIDFWIPLVQVVSILMAGFLFIHRFKNRVFAFFFLWFLLGWVLHSQLIPLDGTVSDRWFYFPIIGLLGMIVIGTFRFFPLKQRLIIVLCGVLGGLILLGLTLRTQFRIDNWKNPETLFTHDLKVDSDSFYLNNNLGLEFFTGGKYDQAIPYFEKTIQLSLANSNAWYVAQTNLGSSYLFKGDYQQAEKPLVTALKSNNVKPARAYLALLINSERLSEAKIFLAEARKKFVNDPVIEKIATTIN